MYIIYDVIEIWIKKKKKMKKIKKLQQHAVEYCELRTQTKTRSIVCTVCPVLKTVSMLLLTEMETGLSVTSLNF